MTLSAASNMSKISSEQKAQELILSTLLDGQTRLGGRIVMLECKDIPYLICFYEQFGFIKLEKDYQEGDLIQLIKILREDEIIEGNNI